MAAESPASGSPALINVYPLPPRVAVQLFTRGTLTKPTKGVLLFGPPGTGKVRHPRHPGHHGAIWAATAEHLASGQMYRRTALWAFELV